MKEHEKIELRSDDVQEILGTPPSWLIRWGTTISLLIVLALGYLSYKYKYPEIVNGEFVLTTTNPPREVISHTEGYMEILYAIPNTLVKEGDILAVIKNDAIHNDVKILERHLDSLQVMRSALIPEYQPPEGLNLGEIGVDFSEFKRILNDYKLTVWEPSVLQNIKSIQDQINDLKAAIKTDEDRKNSAIQTLKLTNNWLEGRKKLLTSKQISYEEYEGNLSEKYKVENDIRNIQSEIKAKERDIKDLDLRIEQIKQNSRMGSSAKLAELKRSIENLRRSVDNWKQRYLIISPTEGLVQATDFKCCEEYIRKGRHILDILPEQEETIIAKVEIPNAGSGKVMEGQTVHLKLASFPAHEYGFILGRVKTKTMNYQRGGYTLEVTLENDMTTSKGRLIPFERLMQGEAEIITEKQSVFNRIFGKLLGIF